MEFEIFMKLQRNVINFNSALWPDVNIKSSPIISKVAKKVITSIFILNTCFSK